MDADAPTNEPHEGEWIYVSAPLTHLNGSAKALCEQITVTIRSLGWIVFHRADGDDDLRGERRLLEALRTADACVFDVSSPSEIVGAEIATAVCSGRPVIALEHESHPAATFISALLDRSRGRTLIRYRDVDDCIDTLTRTLEDVEWRRAVAHAAADAV
jgi:hypothetical protein